MYRKLLSRSLSSIALFAAVSMPAAAQTFAGSTTGCFYQVPGCTATSVASAPAAGPGVSFTGNTFSVNAPGPLLLTGSNSLGVITVGIDPNAASGWSFLLNVGFTMPNGVAPAAAGANLYTAGLTGTFTNKNDVLSLNFDNTAHTFNYLGGSFTLNVSNDLTFTRTNNGNSETSSAQINGQITLLPPVAGQIVNPAAVVPEPGTYALVAAGLAILGVAARRRRTA